MRSSLYDIGVRCFLKDDEVVKTIFKWLRMIAKVYIYAENLFEVEFKVMIAMQRYVLRVYFPIYL